MYRFRKVLSCAVLKFISFIEVYSRSVSNYPNLSAHYSSRMMLQLNGRPSMRKSAIYVCTLGNLVIDPLHYELGEISPTLSPSTSSPPDTGGFQRDFSRMRMHYMGAHKSAMSIFNPRVHDASTAPGQVTPPWYFQLVQDLVSSRDPHCLCLSWISPHICT